MPKTAKKGFTYFRFETDHFYDPKVKMEKPLNFDPFGHAELSLLAKI